MNSRDSLRGGDSALSELSTVLADGSRYGDLRRGRMHSFPVAVKGLPQLIDAAQSPTSCECAPARVLCGCLRRARAGQDWLRDRSGNRSGGNPVRPNCRSRTEQGIQTVSSVTETVAGKGEIELCRRIDKRRRCQRIGNFSGGGGNRLRTDCIRADQPDRTMLFGRTGRDDDSGGAAEVIFNFVPS